MKEKNVKSPQEKGITLIALVVTIVVLLILAGVSITVLFGDSGIIKMAQEAAQKTQKAAEKDNEDLGKLDEYLTSGKWGNAPEEPIEPPIIPKEDETLQPTPENKGKILIGSNKEYNDGEKTAIIPAGFCVVKDIEGDINNITNGLVISDVAEDDLDNIAGGNQFVWIPVENIDNFIRINGFDPFGRQSIIKYSNEAGKEGDSITTDESKEMYQSVSKNKGFYIARFEAGIDGIKEINEDKNKAQLTDGSVLPVSKKGVAPWNFILWEEAKRVSNLMYEKNASYVATTLCYGVQWDAVMQFIEPQYINVPKEGEEEKVSENSFVRNGSGKGVFGGTTKLTGQYQEKHIYDLVGNLPELTMEGNEDLVYTRGGSRLDDSYSLGASCRMGVAKDSITYRTFDGIYLYEGGITFRIALYIE